MIIMPKPYTTEEINSPKKHYKLPIPKDTAWDKVKWWKKFIPYWVRDTLIGIKNLYIWFNVVYNDHNWDGYYIFEILKFKLIQQQKYLIENNRHMGIEQINRDITICLNLIELIQDETYGMEYQNYCKDEFNWLDVEDKPDLKELEIKHISENFDSYFKKYKSAVKKLLKQNRKLSKSKRNLALALSNYNQKRCQDLLFKILNEKINTFWD